MSLFQIFFSSELHKQSLCCFFCSYFQEILQTEILPSVKELSAFSLYLYSSSFDLFITFLYNFNGFFLVFFSSEFYC